jgi:hypothetical protein
MNSLTEAVVTILTAIVGVAILAVLVGQKSQTSSVIQAAGSAFGNSLAVAESPVTGSSVTPTLTYPGGIGGISGF